MPFPPSRWVDCCMLCTLSLNCVGLPAVMPCDTSHTEAHTEERHVSAPAFGMAEVPATPRQSIPHVTTSTAQHCSPGRWLAQQSGPSLWQLLMACSALQLKQSQASGLVLLLRQSARLQLLAGAADSPQACATAGCATWPPTLFSPLNTLPCLQDLLTRHKAMVAVYLSEHYRSFFQDYSKLLQSSNYVTRRQSLKVSLLHISLASRVYNLHWSRQ